jgi:hypothetical protein
MGWKIPEIGANGGSQGKKRRMNVDAVTAAKRMKRRPLKIFYEDITGLKHRNLPVGGAEKQAFGHEIRPDGRCIVKRHLFEAETEHKEESSKEVLPCSEKVDRKECKT